MPAEIKPRKYTRFTKDYKDPISGRFLNNNPGKSYGAHARKTWKGAEWYQKMLQASEISMDITITVDNPRDNAGPNTHTRKIRIKSSKDFKTVIFAMLLSEVLNHGDVSAARELLNRAEAVPKDQLPQQIPNPFDDMTDDEIKSRIIEYQNRKLIPICQST